MKTLCRFLVLHGPNLNLLGVRDPIHYGSRTLDHINQDLQKLASAHDCELQTLQSNHEAELIDAIQNSPTHYDYLLINAAALTHTSIALRDALLDAKLPFIEIHMSNIFAREKFRQHSYLSDIAAGVISGLGAYSYQAAFLAALHQLQNI